MDATSSYPPFLSKNSAFKPCPPSNTDPQPDLPPSPSVPNPSASNPPASNPSVSNPSPVPDPSASNSAPSADHPPTSLLNIATLHLVSLYRRSNPDFHFVHAVPRRCLTKPPEPAFNHDWDNRDHDYILYVNDVLEDNRGNQFTVLDLLGTGTFGQVVKCLYKSTGDIVAVKVIKNQPAYFNQAWVEINILRILHRQNHPDHPRHIVKFYSHFVFRGHLCLVFERLSINLYELLKQNSYTGIGVDLLRNFLTQILDALLVLVRAEVIHCDLKPENILVKALDTTDLKLIDFGSACQLHYPVYSYVQSRFYRSPEVLLGLPKYDSKIDMWSLGCVAAELFLGIPLFPGQNEMNMICRMVEMLGDIPDRFLQRCHHTLKFFNSNPVALNLLHSNSSNASPDMRVYQLKSLAQYEAENSVTLPPWKRFFKQHCLRDIVMAYPKRSAPPHAEELEMRECLVDLLNGMLKFDPKERWTPSEVLQHPFLSGRVLPNVQPWTPPTRPRRLNRSRAVPIGQMVPLGLPVAHDGDYSASAPNFNASGPLAAMQSHWAGPNVPAANAGSGEPGGASGSAFNSYGNAAFAYSGEPDGSGGMGQPPTGVFATPGSYIPPSVVSSFVPPPVLQATRSAGHGVSASSYDARSFFYRPPAEGPPAAPRRTGYQSQFQPLRHGASRAVSDSPSGVMAMAPPVSFGVSPGGSSSARRDRPTGGLGNSSLRNSISRESLTGSLHQSPSRESLGVQRDAAASDLVEEGFAIGSDDEGAFPGVMSLQTSILQGSTTLGAPHNHPGSGAGGTSAVNSTAAHPGSAALPPPGPRLTNSNTRPGAGASFGNPSTLASYGYGYENSQSTQQANNNPPLPSASDGNDLGGAIPPSVGDRDFGIAIGDPHEMSQGGMDARLSGSFDDQCATTEDATSTGDNGRKGRTDGQSSRWQQHGL